MSPKGAYFTRGSGHNQYGGYTEDSAEYQVVVDRLARKFKRAAGAGAAAGDRGLGQSDVGLIAIGSSDGAAREATRHPGASAASRSTTCGSRAFPFGEEVEALHGVASR